MNKCVVCFVTRTGGFDNGCARVPRNDVGHERRADYQGEGGRDPLCRRCWDNLKDGTRARDESRIIPRDSLTTSTPDEFKMAPPAF